jgi:threonine aldolase
LIGVLVDLRSDTVTRPTAAMRRAMAEAEVGDDGSGEDPTVNRLEELFAEITGKDAAMFVPSGTMGNQVALRTLTRPGDAVVVGGRQHVIAYELGAGSLNTGVTFLAVPDARGPLDLPSVEGAIEAGDYHQPKVTLIAVEDSHMAAGGRIWPATDIADLAAVAARSRIPIHLDGARLWNAAVASGMSVAERAATATTVMCCLSKGLSAPVGSLLAGPSEVMAEARAERKRLGGGMRQAGVIAAAGLVAIREGFDRLAEDHEKAKRIAAVVAEKLPGCGCEPVEVETNIVLFTHHDGRRVVDRLRTKGVLADMIGPSVVRLVTHADVDDHAIGHACQVLSEEL